MAAGVALRLLRAVQFQAAPEADEAIVGLMARHIRSGEAWPVFYYGQAYLGALEAYVAALLGASPLALKLTPAIFSIALIGVLYGWVREAFGRDAARVAAVLMAFPPAYLMDFGLRARGGFIEAIFLLTAALWLSHRVARGGSDRLVALLGLVCGLILWTYQAFAAHLLVLAAIHWRAHGLPDRRRLALGAAGCLAGCAPLILYNIAHPFATVWELGVKYAGVTGALYKAHGAAGAVAQGLFRRLLDALTTPAQVLILYTSDPDVEVPGYGPFALTAVSIQAAAAVAAVWMRRNDRGRPSPATVALSMLAATLATGFYRSRYMMPGVVLVAALAGCGLTHRRVRPLLLAAALALVAGYNLRQAWGDLRTDAANPYGDLIDTLNARGIRYGYTGYEIAYPVAFLSEERITLSPKAGPVHFDRLPRGTERVRAQARVCFIFEDGSETDARFRALLADRDASCERIRAGRFAVYDGLPPEVAHTIPMPVGVTSER